jgi:hypothetical protein
MLHEISKKSFGYTSLMILLNVIMLDETTVLSELTPALSEVIVVSFLGKAKKKAEEEARKAAEAAKKAGEKGAEGARKAGGAAKKVGEKGVEETKKVAEKTKEKLE